MRDLALIEFMTLDGVIQSLGSPDEDREEGFEYGGWSAPYGDEVLGRSASQGLAGTTAYLFGRKTYEKMAGYWPFQPNSDPFAAHLNSTPKYVATKTLETLDWDGAQLLDGSISESVARLKADGDGTIAVLGSGVLAQTLIDQDLVDRYRLFVHPLLLGAGKRLFQQGPGPRPLRLLDCTPTTTGVLLLTYEPI